MTNDKIEEILSEIEPFDIMRELFIKGDFDFIIKGRDKNGVLCKHEKQSKALKILRNLDTNILVYGGAAGGGKTFLGCIWLLFMCVIYPNTKWYVARNELKSLVSTVYETFKDICKTYGFEDYKFNAVKNFIKFGNGSLIDFLEIKYNPSDPYFEDLGSYEFTGGWIEEAGEIHEDAAKAIRGRTGRWKNSKDLPIKILITCNPKKNWLYYDYYIPSLTNDLPKNVVFLEALITDNVFMGKEYIENLKETYKNDSVNRERLLNGNWDYEDSPDLLCDYEMIEQIFTNDHVPQGRYTYLTADIARQGADLAVICVWRGWRMIHIETFKKSTMTLLQNRINALRKMYRIPKNRCIADEDGIGGSVVDNCGILGFLNGSTPIKEKGVSKAKKEKGIQRSSFETPNYRNLQVQCLYHLANKINDGGLWIMCDVTDEQKKHIKEELDQIRSKISDIGKLDCKSKTDIITSIRRSPDYRDTILMRVSFDLKPARKRRPSSRPRCVI